MLSSGVQLLDKCIDSFQLHKHVLIEVVTPGTWIYRRLVNGGVCDHNKNSLLMTSKASHQRYKKPSEIHGVLSR